jgi:DNA-binding transcriptional ArsR family regulator
MAKGQDEVRITDPSALRALAHPARLTVVDELYQGNERTASELAELTGLTPSAMSYHLRALERWGVVERAEARGDRRERPWRGRSRSFLLEPGGSKSAAAATDVILGGYLQHLRDEFRRWSLAEAGEDEVWRKIAGGRRSYLWLSREEAAAFAAELGDVLERYTSGRDAASHPEGARRIECLLAIVPEATEHPSASG